MPEQKMQNSKSKIWILLVLVLVILLGVGGFFYWKNYLAKSNEQGGERSEPPRLFGKEDYRVEEKEDGKYIVVDKVGLRVKVPEGWRVEMKNTPDAEGNEYWVDMYSENATGTSYLKRGCGISIIVTKSEEYNQEIREKIVKLKNNESLESYGIVKIIENKVVNIENKEALGWLSDVHEIAGQFTGIGVPIGLKNVLEIKASFAKGFSSQCLPIWQEFMKTIEIK